MSPEQYVQDKAAKSGSSFYYAFLFLPAPRRAAITAFAGQFVKTADPAIIEELRARGHVSPETRLRLAAQAFAAVAAYDAEVAAYLHHISGVRFPEELTVVLRKQRDLAHELLTLIPGVSCVKPKAAMYLFPRLDPKLYPIHDDQKFILNLLEEERVLVVQGTGFNWPRPDHIRVVFLPHEEDLTEAIGRMSRFLDRNRAHR